MDTSFRFTVEAAPQPPADPQPAQVRDVGITSSSGTYSIQDIINEAFQAGDSGKTADGIVLVSGNVLDATTFTPVQAGSKIASTASVGSGTEMRFRIEFRDGTLSQELTMTPASETLGSWETAEFTHPGTASKDTLTGLGYNKDIFTVDAVASNRDDADVIANFEDGRDEIRFSDSSITAVYAKVVGGDTVLYSDRAAGNAGDDANILAVIEGVQVTSSDFTTDDFDGSFVTTVEVL